MNPVNVEALEACRVWVIGSEKLRVLLNDHPGFAEKVLVNFGRMLRVWCRWSVKWPFIR